MLGDRPSPPGRARIVLCLLTLAGAIAAAVPASANHGSGTTGDNPAAYGEPHAGWVAPPRASGRLAPATGALLGVHPEDSMSGPIDADHQKIIETERRLGRTLDINNTYYSSFSDIADNYEPGNPDKRGLSDLAFWDVESGRIPLVGWACGSSRSIASGALDPVIHKTAEAFKAFGSELFMRYCWEMDGSKRTKEVGQPQDFVAAWTHIWEIFKDDGVTNVVWVWCGNANSFKNKNQLGYFAWDYYPGDAYVDWVSADGYNWGAAKRGGDRWRGMVEIFDEFMVWARSTGTPAAAVPEPDFPTQFPRKAQVKPIMIGEYGAIEDRADHTLKAKWMVDTHDALNGNRIRTPACSHCGIYSDIAAVVYFDINADAPNQNGDWRIISSTESESAYKRAAADDPWFRQIHTIGWAPAANRSDRPAQSPTPQSPTPPVTTPPITVPSGVSSSPTRSGYWMVSSDGEVYAFGDATDLGDARSALGQGAKAVDLEPTPSGQGYWVVDDAGHVFAYGDALSHGGAQGAGLVSTERVTSLSSTPSGAGYWLFTSKGRVISRGDAVHFGDMAKETLNGPVLDSIPTPSGRGYYMVASDGGIFAFGDARFFGSMGSKPLNAPVQSLVPDSDGTGYWLVASDGGVFAFEAPFRGSMGAKPLNQPVTGMVPYGDGYLMVGEDGGVFNFSDRPFSGSLGSKAPAHPVVSVATL